MSTMRLPGLLPWLPAWLLIAGLYGWSGAQAAGAAPGDARPDAALTPVEVVRCQMEALRRNDRHDSGIEVAFRFASPANKRVTGPLPRFADMIKQSYYRVMLDYQLIEYGEVRISENRASVPVTLLTEEFLAVRFRFSLSRQTHAECAGCWMTDAVILEGAEQLPGLQT